MTTVRDVYVSPHGNDANDGRSWDRAKRTLGAAIELAQASGELHLNTDLGRYEIDETLQVPEGLRFIPRR